MKLAANFDIGMGILSIYMEINITFLSVVNFKVCI